jgi:hypothetical protein
MNMRKMDIRKRKLANIDMCYAVSFISLNAGPGLLFASEMEGGPCCLFSGSAFDAQSMVWERPGGTMSVVPLDGRPGQFLAIQGFFPVFRSEKAEIVFARQAGAEWLVDTLIKFPFCHRFDILRAGGREYFLGAGLCGSKRHQEDWSDPGKLLAGRFEAGLITELAEIQSGRFTRNHGFCKVRGGAGEYALIACDQGVYQAKPPLAGGDWSITKLLEAPASDVASLDIDGDGARELAAIEPFHGNRLCIYKEAGGIFEKIYESLSQREFYHALCACELRGRPVFLAGCRGGRRELVMIAEEGGIFSETVLDEGGGPANIAVLNTYGADYIAAANHGQSEAVLYTVT